METLGNFTNNERDLRAKRFASQIIGMLRYWLPDNGKAYRLIFDEIYENASRNNLEIVAIPPELDASKWLKIQHEMYSIRHVTVEELDGVGV